MERSKVLKKFSLPSVLLIIFSIVLAACGDPTAATTSATPATTRAATTTANGVVNPVTITWSFWGDDSEIAVNKKIIDQFEKLNPSIKVKPLNEPWTNYFKRVDTEWVGDKAPDVMFMTYVPTYASKGLLADLTPYLEKEKDFKLEDFYPNLLKQLQYNGKQYALPRDNDTKVIYVNLKLLQEAGVSLPKAGWTWQDLQDASKKLTKRSANGEITQYGFGFEVNEWWKLWIWENGGEIFDSFSPPEPPKHLLINTPQGAKALQFFADLINQDKVTPSYETLADGNNLAKLFTEGKLAMTFGNHSNVPTFSNTPNLSWDVVPLPQGTQRANVIGGAGYAIHRDAPHKAEAWQFLKFLSSELGQGLFMETGVVVPARQSIREDNAYTRNSKYNWQVFTEETKVGKQYPEFRESNNIYALIDKELAPVWKGQKPAAEVLATLPGLVDPILAKS